MRGGELDFLFCDFACTVSSLGDDRRLGREDEDLGGGREADLAVSRLVGPGLECGGFVVPLPGPDPFFAFAFAFDGGAAESRMVSACT